MLPNDLTGGDSLEYTEHSTIFPLHNGVMGGALRVLWDIRVLPCSVCKEFQTGII